MDQQLLKTANRKQQNTDNVILLVENCDIKLKILNKSTHLNQSQAQITMMSELFFCEGFSLVHIIITTIIRPYAILFIWIADDVSYRKMSAQQENILRVAVPPVSVNLRSDENISIIITTFHICHE